MSLPDLVVDSKLETVIQRDCVRHTFRRRGRAGQDWRVEVAETWTRKRRLGSGSFGTVWLEECEEPAAEDGPRVRAVKEIRTVPGSKVDCSRELLAIAKFSSPKYVPSFVRSYGWFGTPQAIYITMEYLEHGDLNKHLGRPLPEDEARMLGRQVLEGLMCMHENGFVHRDLKPQNILVVSPGPDWLVQISDFGISRRLEEGTTVTLRQGTLGFMAPELLGFIRGGSSPYAVDMWSLGALVFFVLSKTIFMGDLHKLRDFTDGTMAISDAEFEVLRGLGISDQCARFLHRLLAPLPDDRPSSQAASEDSWLATVNAGTQKGISRYRVEGSSRAAAPATVSATEPGTQASATWSSAKIAGPQLYGRPSSPREPPGPFSDPAGFKEPEPTWGTKVSRLVASGSTDQTIRVWDPATGHCRVLLSGHSTAVTAVAFVPGSPSSLVSASDRKVKLWDLTTGQCQTTLRGFPKSTIAPALSPDTQTLALVRKKAFLNLIPRSNAIEIWDVTKGRPVRTLEGHRARITAIAFSPNSRLLASGARDMTVKIWDLATGQCRQTLEGHYWSVTAVAFSRDSRLVAVASDHSETIKVWELPQGRCRHTLGDLDRPHVGNALLTFSPDSTLLVSVSKTTIRVWHLATNRCLRRIEHHIESWRRIAMACSPDLSTLALTSGGDTVILWNLATGERLHELRGHEGIADCVAFSWE